MSDYNLNRDDDQYGPNPAELLPGRNQSANYS